MKNRTVYIYFRDGSCCDSFEGVSEVLVTGDICTFRAGKRFLTYPLDVIHHVEEVFE